MRLCAPMGEAAAAEMTPHPAIRRSAVIAGLLCGGAIVPVAGWTHWEGFEAADPSTPAALLRFESAAAGYVEADVTPGSWLARFEVDGQSAEPVQTPAAAAGERDAMGAGEHSGHSGVDFEGAAEKLRRLIPQYMVMGDRGMAEMASMHMELPENTLPMMSGEGPYGPIGMGGMFTVVKVRADHPPGDYSDPGWYEPPAGSMACRSES